MFALPLFHLAWQVLSTMVLMYSTNLKKPDADYPGRYCTMSWYLSTALRPALLTSDSINMVATCVRAGASRTHDLGPIPNIEDNAHVL